MAESDWHKKWKEDFGIEFSEKKIGNNRADIVAPDGTVIELQHSSISNTEIDKREKAYGSMAWIVDATALCQGKGDWGILAEGKSNPEYRSAYRGSATPNDLFVTRLFGQSLKDSMGYIGECPCCRLRFLRFTFLRNNPFIKCINGCDFINIERGLVSKLSNPSIQYGYFQELKYLNHCFDKKIFKYKFGYCQRLGYDPKYYYSNYPYIIKVSCNVRNLVYKWLDRKSTILFDLDNGKYILKCCNKTPEEILEIENKIQHLNRSSSDYIFKFNEIYNLTKLKTLDIAGTKFGHLDGYLFLLKEIVNREQFVLGGYLLSRQKLLEFFKKGTYAENNRQ